jgi:N utilization substance protein B
MADESHAAASMKDSRRARAGAARLAAVQTVYQTHAAACDMEDAARIYLDRFAGMDVDGEALVPPDRALYARIVRGVSDRMGDLKALMEGHLSPAAVKDTQDPQDPAPASRRVDPLLEAILLCGLHELLAHTETDAPVIISEYLHVTRAFYDGRETALVNAVLDAAAKTLRTGSA